MTKIDAQFRKQVTLCLTEKEKEEVNTLLNKMPYLSFSGLAKHGLLETVRIQLKVLELRELEANKREAAILEREGVEESNADDVEID